jgi:hypothetical protein
MTPRIASIIALAVLSTLLSCRASQKNEDPSSQVAFAERRYIEPGLFVKCKGTDQTGPLKLEVIVPDNPARNDPTLTFEPLGIYVGFVPWKGKVRLEIERPRGEPAVIHLWKGDGLPPDREQIDLTIHEDSSLNPDAHTFVGTLIQRGQYSYYGVGGTSELLKTGSLECEDVQRQLDPSKW